MARLREAVGREDDWTGITSATERRKRQNRLNSRAFRRRKAAEETWCRQGSRNTICQEETEQHISCWSEAHQTVVDIPISKIPRHLRDRKAPLLPYTTTPIKLDDVHFPLSPDHLLTLIQYNVLRACLTNRAYISLLNPKKDEPESTSLVVLPDLDRDNLKSLLPPSLRPTNLQKSTPHAAWIDILPHPILRDNLIRATTASCSEEIECSHTSPPDTEPDLSSRFDEDAFWTDSVGGLFEGFSSTETDHAGCIVWEKPWDINGWELSEGFWRKYAWLFRGIEMEVLTATNRWRRIRGEDDLVVVNT